MLQIVFTITDNAEGNMMKKTAVCLILVLLAVFSFTACGGGGGGGVIVPTGGNGGGTPKTWGGAVEIDAGANHAVHPQVAMDANGNAIAVWRQFDGTYVYDIYAKRYDALTDTWGEAVLLEVNTYRTTDPKVAVDASGNAIAVWSQYDGTLYDDIYANRYDAKTGTWGGAVIIDAGNYHTGVPQVAVDAGGNAIVVWAQSDSVSVYDIYANRYDAVTGTWGGAVMINAGADSASRPQVALDASGNAIAVWRQDDGVSFDIYARRYDALTGTWGGAVIIDAGNDYASAPQVAVDASGNAIAVWMQEDGVSFNVYANRYDALTGTWEGVLIIDATTGKASTPNVSVDASGNAIAVWLQINNIYANHYDAVTGTWDGALIIEMGAGNAPNDPQVSVDASGKAIAVWWQWDGTYDNVYVNHFQ
jgi:hypothetical protein